MREAASHGPSPRQRRQRRRSEAGCCYIGMGLWEATSFHDVLLTAQSSCVVIYSICLCMVLTRFDYFQSPHESIMNSKTTDAAGKHMQRIWLEQWRRQGAVRVRRLHPPRKLLPRRGCSADSCPSRVVCAASVIQPPQGAGGLRAEERLPCALTAGARGGTGPGR